jgi:hypothetical protein
MSESINDIKEEIDKGWLGDYLGSNYAEQLVFTDYNLQLLNIDIEDLKNETYDNIEHIGFVKYDDWDTLKTLVSEKEVKAIQEEFREDIERYRNEHECDSSPCDCNLNLYKAILYCNEDYVWGSTTFSFDD